MPLLKSSVKNSSKHSHREIEEFGGDIHNIILMSLLEKNFKKSGKLPSKSSLRNTNTYASTRPYTS